MYNSQCCRLDNKKFKKGIDNSPAMMYNISTVAWRVWAHSSAGRASALQAEGHRFEPCCAHHIPNGESLGNCSSVTYRTAR